MSWLLNSMESSVADGFLFLDSTHEIWESIVEIYGGRENLARVYQLHNDIAKVVKGDKVFYYYLYSLKSMWDELHFHRPLSTNLETLKKRRRGLHF